jgi:hypothetical protein
MGTLRHSSQEFTDEKKAAARAACSGQIMPAQITLAIAWQT